MKKLRTQILILPLQLLNYQKKKKKKPIQGKDLTVVFQSSLILKISNTFVLLLSIGNHGGVLWPREAMQRDFSYVR